MTAHDAGELDARGRRLRAALAAVLVRIRRTVSSWPASIWIAFASMIISACALWLSSASLRAEREHKRLSVRPLVSVWASENLVNLEYSIKNAGLGPAIIKWMSAKWAGTHGEEDLESWADFASAAVLELNAKASFNSLSFYTGTLDNAAVRPEDGAVSLIRIHWKPAPKIPQPPYPRLILRVCYCSMYAECWITIRLMRLSP
jgi:hypothetical protein